MSDKTAEMWAALEAYQPKATASGHGESWRVMCKERTYESIRSAYDATPIGSAAGDVLAAASCALAQRSIKWINKAMISSEQITIGRLRKRIVKLTQQRDSAQKLNEHYKEIVNRHPFVKSFENKYQKALAERQELESLRKRVKEQEELITRLLNETNKREEKL